MVPRSTILEVHRVADRLGQLADTADCEHVDTDALRQHRDSLRALARRLPHAGVDELARECEQLIHTGGQLQQIGSQRTCCLYRRPVLHLTCRLSATAETITRSGR